MSAIHWTTFVCTAALVPALVSGAESQPDMIEPESPSVPAALTPGAVAPWPMLHARLPERVADKVSSAVLVAREHLRDNASCRALFTRLGADGVDKINGSSYYPAGKKQERKYCRRGRSFAATTVGGSDVVLCKRFGRLSDERAAIILIHEALHFAGQTESPVDPGAPDADAITRMVMQGCRFF